MANVVLMLYWRFDPQSGLHSRYPDMDITCPTPCHDRQVEQWIEALNLYQSN
jgi:hypothetical protein